VVTQPQVHAAPRQPLRVTTTPLLRVENLLALLPPEESAAWVRRGEGLIGWGVAARLQVRGDERFSRTQRWWSDLLAPLTIEDSVSLPGTGPVAFGSFAFDPRQPSEVIVPRIVIGLRAGQAWVTALDTPVPTEPPLTSVPDAPTTVRWSEGSRSPLAWQQSVAQALARIDTGEVDKVVLARDVLAHVSGSLDVRYLLQRLAAHYPSCWTFHVVGLVGATPELLVRRTGDLVTSRVLAGTVRTFGDADADEGMAQALLGSGKDLEEHEYAVRSVARALATHCTDLEVPDHPRVLELANVQHLATDVTGRLADTASVLSLVASLHPTAAVCGTPTERAFSVISELEGMDRGRYAGPVGWFDSQGDGEFGIALRCAEIDTTEGTARAFAGCGIVAGSEPENELTESNAKLVPIRDALEASS
jgi:menaquinone-specific isochorismate synthase